MDCDLLIVGAGTTGAYLAAQMVKRGHRVMLIDALPRERVGTKYDIFHVEAKEFERLELPRPVEGDPEWAFEFEKNYNADPLTRYPKCQINRTVGLHMHEYTMLLHRLAKEAGADILYECAFLDFLFDAQGKISGARVRCPDGEHEMTVTFHRSSSDEVSTEPSCLPAMMRCTPSFRAIIGSSFHSFVSSETPL